MFILHSILVYTATHLKHLGQVGSELPAAASFPNATCSAALLSTAEATYD